MNHEFYVSFRGAVQVPLFYFWVTVNSFIAFYREQIILLLFLTRIIHKKNFTAENTKTTFDYVFVSVFISNNSGLSVANFHANL